MAEIRLDKDEADGELPDVCMCCGEESTVTKKKNMSWCPPWVGFLILVAWPVWLIVMILMTKRATLQAPLCDQHKNHWLIRTLIVAGSGVLFALMAVLGFIGFAVLDPRVGEQFGWIGCLGGIGLFVTWIIILIVCQNTAIRPKEITDDEITLQGVSDAFVEALDERHAAKRARRKKAMRSRDDEDEDEEEPAPPPKKKPASNAITTKKRPPAEDIEEDEAPRPRKKRPPADDDE
jgi:hypothetical protein